MEIDQGVHVEEIRLQRKSGKFELENVRRPVAAPVGGTRPVRPGCPTGLRVLCPLFAAIWAAAGEVTRDYES